MVTLHIYSCTHAHILHSLSQLTRTSTHSLSHTHMHTHIHTHTHTYTHIHPHIHPNIYTHTHTHTHTHIHTHIHTRAQLHHSYNPNRHVSGEPAVTAHVLTKDHKLDDPAATHLIESLGTCKNFEVVGQPDGV